MVSNAALIVIVLVCALTSVSLAAGIFSVVSPASDILWAPSAEQQRYMREVRIRHFCLLRAERNPRYDKFSSQTVDIEKNPGLKSTVEIEKQPSLESTNEP